MVFVKVILVKSFSGFPKSRLKHSLVENVDRTILHRLILFEGKRTIFTYDGVVYPFLVARLSA
jgi:hypothetical protein